MMTDEQKELLACEWSDYKNIYGGHMDYHAFKAGFESALGYSQEPLQR